MILGDRNFGVLWIAHEAQQRGQGVVLRLTEVRAHKLVGGPIARPGEYPVVWRATRWDGGEETPCARGCGGGGSADCRPRGAGQKQAVVVPIHDAGLAGQKLVEVYGERWKIETDLRSLKRTVRLHHMTAKSQDMLEKELVIAVCAYNLVRAVMCLAARKSRIDPRRLSFALVLNVVDCAWPKLVGASTQEQFQREFSRVLKLAAQCALPNRKRRRSYPRLLWRRTPSATFRKREN